MRVLLREGYDYALPGELGVYQVADVAPDLAEVGQLVHLDPEENLKQQRAVAELLKEYRRRRLRQYARLLRCDPADALDDLLDGRTVCHADRHVRPDAAVGQRAVYHDVLKELAVRDQHLNAVEPPHAGTPCADVLDPSGIYINLDDVADPHRTLDHEDDAAEEVVEDVLRAEADPDDDCTAEEGEHGNREVEHLQGRKDQHDEQQVVHYPLDEDSRVFVEVGVALQVDHEPFRNPTDDKQPDDEDNDSYDRLAEIDGVTFYGEQLKMPDD